MVLSVHCLVRRVSTAQVGLSQGLAKEKGTIKQDVEIYRNTEHMALLQLCCVVTLLL